MQVMPTLTIVVPWEEMMASELLQLGEVNKQLVYATGKSVDLTGVISSRSTFYGRTDGLGGGNPYKRNSNNNDDSIILDKEHSGRVVVMLLTARVDQSSTPPPYFFLAVNNNQQRPEERHSRVILEIASRLAQPVFYAVQEKV
ncbi:hypothetical protein KIN20_001335 [Parelaphostrongylus tenuis]|uniref:Uncharacterized protein n=1 Tax=Parelaphostrongylus tenuis TaxID=148309 RepID=A0AAD5QEG6_PARTN|nr:hypothetical protein KIN20_001335 [Parelaphostrongylus tenuis]